MKKGCVLAFTVFHAIHNKGIPRLAGGGAGLPGQPFAAAGLLDLGLHAAREVPQDLGVTADMLRINTHLYAGFAKNIVEKRAAGFG